MRRCFKATVLFLLLRCLLCGQQYRFDVYDQTKGLGNIEIHGIAFDREGYLWIATINGVFRFLGSHFEHYGPEQGLKDRSVDQINVDEDGRVWASTSTDLYLWKGDRFASARLDGSRFGELAGLISVGTNRLLMLREHIVFEVVLDSSGVVTCSKPIFSASQLVNRPELKRVASVERGKDGTLWLGCANRICSYRDGITKVWGPESGVPERVWYTLLVDREGGLWAKANGKLIHLPPGSGAFLDRSPPQTAPNRFFPWMSMIEDRSGRIVLRAAAGVLRWENGAWRTIGRANGFDSSTTTSIAQDQNGDLWLGTLRGLWHWVGYEHWESWTEAQGLPESSVWSLNPALEGKVAIGTARGPALLDPLTGRVKSPFSKTRWPWAQVKGINQNVDGSIWMTTFAGNVLRSDKQLASVRSVADLRKLAVRSWIDKNSRGWIAGDSGVYSFDAREARPKFTQEFSPLAWGDKDPSISLAPGSDNSRDTELWVPTRHRLMARRAGRWENPEISGLSLQSIKLSEVSEGTNGLIYACGEDQLQQSAVWRLDRVAGGNLRASRVPLPEQLRSGVMFSILVDRRGWLWLGTDRGLAGWNGTQWRIFNRESGVIWDDTNRNVLREAPDGSIWIGTSGGVSHLMQPETVFDPVSLPIRIDSAQENDELAGGPALRDLPWEHNRLSFRFSSSAMWNRTTLWFQYRIPELDSAWTAIQNTNAVFSNLPPGKYRFQVFAQNASTGSRSQLVESSFRILPPWWKTWWFYLCCAIGSVLLVWLLLLVRTRQLQTNKRNLERTVQEMWAETHRLAERAQDAALAEERNRLAHELHDSLAAAFTAIFVQLEAATDLADSDAHQSRACMARAEELSRNGLRHVREFAQSLIARSNQPAPSVSALRELITFATAGTSIASTFEVQGRERPLKPLCALALARILQEAVGNSQRYAKAKAIDAILRFDERRVSLAICDDGNGFHADKLIDGGFGLAGMRARAVRLAGTFDLQSSPGNGTKIVVELPDPYQQAQSS